MLYVFWQLGCWLAVVLQWLVFEFYFFSVGRLYTSQFHRCWVPANLATKWKLAMSRLRPSILTVLTASVMCLFIASQKRWVLLSDTLHFRSYVDHWEKVETQELTNHRINDLQGQITGTGALNNIEKIERRFLQRRCRKTENLCWVGEVVMGLQCEKRDLFRCWESFYWQSSEVLNYFLGMLFNLHYWRWLGWVRLASISYGWWRNDPALPSVWTI